MFLGSSELRESLLFLCRAYGDLYQTSVLRKYQLNSISYILRILGAIQRQYYTFLVIIYNDFYAQCCVHEKGKVYERRGTFWADDLESSSGNPSIAHPYGIKWQEFYGNSSREKICILLYDESALQLVDEAQLLIILPMLFNQHQRMNVYLSVKQLEYLACTASQTCILYCQYVYQSKYSVL